MLKKNEIKTKKYKNILLIAGGVSVYMLLMILLFNPLLALGIALILITVFVYLYFKINGRYIKMLDKEFNKTTVNGICIVLILLALIFGIMGIVQGSQKPEGYKNYYNESTQKYDVELVIKFSGNLFFSKYNVEFELYDNSETLYHGVDKTIMVKLPNGKHELEFTGDGMIERVTLDVKGNMRVTYELSCHTSEIQVREISVDYLDKESESSQDKTDGKEIEKELEDNADDKKDDGIVMLVVPSEYIGTDAKITEEDIRNLGYLNVVLEKKKTFEDKTKDNTVADFTIAGKKYERGDKFKATDEVKIVYYKYETQEEIVFPDSSSKLGKDLDSDTANSNNSRYYYNIDNIRNVPSIKKYKNATVTDGVFDYLKYLEGLGYKIEITNVSNKEPYNGFHSYETSFKVSKDVTSWKMDLNIQDEKYIEYELYISF